MGNEHSQSQESHQERYVYIVNIIKHLAHKNASYRLCPGKENLT